MNCVTAPEPVAATAPGIIVKVGTEGVVELILTVNVAVEDKPPDDAVIVVVPDPNAVASPVEEIVATEVLLESHVTEVVRF